MSDLNAVDLPEKATSLAPAEPVALPSVMGATFAERKAARKAVHAAEDKSVESADEKAPRRGRR